MVELGPDQASLRIHTGREGVAAKAGHDLELEVTDWSARYAEEGFTLTAELGSIEVREGHGGAKPLSDGDRRKIRKIRKNITEDVLGAGTIAFRATAPGQGELELNGVTRPVAFELTVADGALRGEASLRQTDFAIKPYTGFFGALKVADEVRITVEGRL